MIVSISAVSAADIADSDDLSQAQDDSAPLEVDEATDVQANDESTQSAETGNDLAPLQTSIDDKGADELSVDKDVEKLSKGNSSVTIDSIKNVTYGEPVVVKYNIDNRSSNVTVSVCYNDGGLQPTVEGAVCDIKDNNVTITNLTAGKYVIFIYNNEDSNYTANSTYAFFNVTKATPMFDVKAYVDEHGIIVANVTTNKTATGEVGFKVDDSEIVPYGITNGTVQCAELKVYPKGTHNVTVIYKGDDNYKNASYNTTVVIDRDLPVLNLVLGTVEGNITINVTATNNTVSGQVNITIFDKNGNLVRNVTKEMRNGVVEEFNLTGFAPNDYKVWVDFLGSKDFYMAYAEDVAEVREQVDMNVTVSVNEYGQIVAVANLTKGATGIVEFTVKNATGAMIGYFNVTVENSTAQYETSVVLPKGNYTVQAYYFGDDYYKDIEVYGDNATIAKEYLEVTPKVTVEGNQANIVFTFSGNATGNATAFFLNYGSNATFAIKNGTVVIDEIFDNGEQSVLLTYDGDDKYYGFYNVYADFYVKASSFIKVNPVTVVYQNTAKVTVTLTDNNDGKGNNPIANAEIVITLNGKTYKGTTDAKGVATISIPANLVPKAYTAKVSYAGTNVTVGDAEDLKFTVKKATPKVTAKKKTFKKSVKVKKYTITLKDNKGKAIKKAKVTIKVGKKTFKATTNAKGKAVFKLKKLTKKAKYNAKITYKGNSYFNKVTKKVKITIK